METIGKYRIEERIGGGGFGEVFKAYDPFIKRHVAIKTCISGDQETADRFFQEAEIGGNLHHRNITTVYDFGVHNGLPYLIQEYLSGEDLDVKIKRRDYLPYSEKLLYLLQIARGLAYAHSKGVIHRDVKPANVRILEDGTAKIMDFGIAKLAQQESGLTQTGVTLGTASYFAPEQVRGDTVDLRTDVFSFGILTYELLAYERPFQGAQISTVLYNLLNHEPAPLTTHWPGAPRELVALVDRCLRKDAGQRFADGTELLRELEKLKKRGRSSRPAETPKLAEATRVAPAATDHGAAELEYHLTPDRLPATEPFRSPPSGGTTGIAKSIGRSRSNASGLVILIVLAAACAAGGWWLGMRDKPDATGQVPAAEQLRRGTNGERPESEEPIATVGPDTGNEAAGPRSSSPPATEPPAATTPARTEAPSRATAGTPPEVPPAPAPATGQLILPRVQWTDRMRARIAAKTYSLNRRHTIELPPGSHRAVFELAAASPSAEPREKHYSPASRTIEVRVEAGRTSSVEIPIPRPGAISVRPLPGRPQGRASIDGELLGPTPLSRIRREPGTYTLEILPRGGEGEGLRQEIKLESGLEIILSFDLDAGTVRTGTKALVQ